MSGSKWFDLDNECSCRCTLDMRATCQGIGQLATLVPRAAFSIIVHLTLLDGRNGKSTSEPLSQYPYSWLTMYSPDCGQLFLRIELVNESRAADQSAHPTTGPDDRDIYDCKEISSFSRVHDRLPSGNLREIYAASFDALRSGDI